MSYDNTVDVLEATQFTDFKFWKVNDCESVIRQIPIESPYIDVETTPVSLCFLLSLHPLYLHAAFPQLLENDNSFSNLRKVLEFIILLKILENGSEPGKMNCLGKKFKLIVATFISAV